MTTGKARKTIKYWKSKFRILDDWKISYDAKAPYKAQCCHNKETKRATIYAWPARKRVAKDYFFHEVLHIVFAAHRSLPSRLRKEAEELIVQDLCVIYGLNSRD